MHLEDILQEIRAFHDEDRSYDRSYQTNHRFFGEPGTLSVFRSQHTSPLTNHIYHEDNSSYAPIGFSLPEESLLGDYTLIHDETFSDGIDAITFFNSYDNAYFSVRANEEDRRRGLTTILDAEHHRRDTGDIYYVATTSETSKQPSTPTSYDEAFDELKTFYDSLQTKIRGNA